MLTLALVAPALAVDKVSDGTNWLAEGEHGGFYQAVADGTYAKAGLDVTIVQGGPQAANEALLISGKIDFYMGGQFSLYDDIKQGIPVINVAALFQKDPQILMTHKGVGMDSFADIAKASTIFMGKDVFVTDFVWMKANFPGFHDEQYKPYTFNPAPFIADKMSAQQGYLTSEPLAVKNASGEEPNVFLFADNGYAPYSTTIETTTKLVKDNPFYAKASVPGKMYKGTDNAQATFGVLATIIASADMPEQTAYVITKAVFDNLEDFKKLHPAVANITKEQMLEGNTVPFHPGAVKYFKEKGMMK